MIYLVSWFLIGYFSLFIPALFTKHSDPERISSSDLFLYPLKFSIAGPLVPILILLIIIRDLYQRGKIR